MGLRASISRKVKATTPDVKVKTMMQNEVHLTAAQALKTHYCEHKS